jgi:pimeloyl-ACP methyl ester carboxylesterase
VIPPLHAKGLRVSAVQNPLTSLADDIDRISKLAEAQQGPTLLVGHSYGGAVISGAGHVPNVVGLVYVAALARDAGENLGGIFATQPPTPGAANIRPDKYGFVWIAPDRLRESFCQDRDETEALIMAVAQEAARSPLLRGPGRGPGVAEQAELVSGVLRGPHDSPGGGRRRIGILSTCPLVKAPPSGGAFITYERRPARS